MMEAEKYVLQYHNYILWYENTTLADTTVLPSLYQGGFSQIHASNLILGYKTL